MKIFPLQSVIRFFPVFCFFLLISFSCGRFFQKQQEQTSVNENRTLATKPKIPTNYKDWQAFPKQWENYFVDHFGLRNAYLKLYSHLQIDLLKKSPTPKALIGQDGWVYFTGETGEAFNDYFLGLRPHSAEELQTWSSEFHERKAWFSAQGIAYMVMIVPEKYTIYPEYLPTRFQYPTRKISRLEAIEAILGEEPSFINLRKPLQENARKQKLYSKMDSHWNGRGAWLAYQKVIEHLQTIYPNITPLPAPIAPQAPANNFYTQDLAAMIGRPQWGVAEQEDMRNFYANQPQFSRLATPNNFLPETLLNTLPKEWAPLQYVNPQASLNKRALIFRDSMAIPLVPLLAEHFSSSIFLTTNRFSKQLIQSIKPDLVIEEHVERASGYLAYTPFHLSEK